MVTERTRRKRRQTRDEIVAAAVDVLLRDGFARFELGPVAEALGVTNPALYYYFRSRDDLLLEVALREHEAVAERVAAAVVTAQHGAHALELQVRAFVDHFTDRLPLFQLAFLYLPLLRLGPERLPELLGRVRPTNDALFGSVERKLRAAQDVGALRPHLHPRRVAVCALTGAIGLLTMRALVEAADDPLIHRSEDLVDELCHLFRAAVAAEEAP